MVFFHWLLFEMAFYDPLKTYMSTLKKSWKTDIPFHNHLFHHSWKCFPPLDIIAINASSILIEWLAAVLLWQLGFPTPVGFTKLSHSNICFLPIVGLSYLSNGYSPKEFYHEIQLSMQYKRIHLIRFQNRRSSVMEGILVPTHSDWGHLVTLDRFRKLHLEV